MARRTPDETDDNLEQHPEPLYHVVTYNRIPEDKARPAFSHTMLVVPLQMMTIMETLLTTSMTAIAASRSSNAAKSNDKLEPPLDIVSVLARMRDTRIMTEPYSMALRDLGSMKSAPSMASAQTS